MTNNENISDAEKNSGLHIRTNSFITLLLVAFLWPSLAGGQSWRSAGQVKPLFVDSTKCLVRLADSLSATQEEYLTAVPGIDSILFREFTPDKFVLCSLSASIDYDEVMDTLEARGEVEYLMPCYSTPNGVEFLVGSEFWALFEDTVGQTYIDSLNVAHGVTIKHESPYMNNSFLLEVSTSSALDALETANLYYDIPRIRYSHPNFGTVIHSNGTVHYEPLDFYRDECIHVQAVVGDYANLNTAWDITTGSSAIVVAVLDGSFEPHEDLPAPRFLAGKDFRFFDEAGGVPVSVIVDHSFDRHGMAVAGLIAATHSTDSSALTDRSSGSLSIAPGVSIMPIVILSALFSQTSSATACEIGEALMYANTVGVSATNNSWGYCDPSIQPDAIDVAFQELYNSGIPSICASGNSADFENPGSCGFVFQQVAYPSSSQWTLSVGAIDMDDMERRFPYSQFSGLLDVVAPSGDGDQINDVFTTDLMDSPGFNSINPIDGQNYCFVGPEPNDDNYVCEFGGTSASCPLVTGIAALIKSKDATLGAQDIYDIIRESADPVFEWGELNKFNFPLGYGHGKADALRALLAITRGDANNDDKINIADVTKLICFVFSDCDSTFRPITPDRLMGDANCTGTVNIADVTFLIARIFSGGPPPPSPCFEYETFGATLKLAVDRSVVFYPETISPGRKALRINTLKTLHAISLTLLAPNGVKLDITKKITGPDLYWSQTGDTVKIGILDIYAQHFITPADTNLLEITGDFEILSVEATQILPGGETVYLTPSVSAAKPTGDLSRITVASFDAIYPNPFNPETRLAFSLPEDAPVKIEVYNILGRKVATVTDERFSAGSHSVLWDGRNESGGKVSSGIYFARFTSGDTVERKKMVILK